MFKNYGLNRLIMALVGFIELFGAIAIWFVEKPLGAFGAMALLATSIGAIFCHLVFDTWKDGIPAFITGCLSAFLLYQNFPVLMSFLQHLLA